MTCLIAPLSSTHGAVDADPRVAPANAAAPAVIAVASNAHLSIESPWVAVRREAIESEPARPRGAEEAPRLGLDEAHPLVHQLERRLARAPRLLRSDREQPLQPALVGAQGLEALAHRGQQIDHPLADGLPELPVTAA